jgi:hypothetical protein
MFVPGVMAIDVIVIVAIMISAFIFAYILTAIIGEWRSKRRARSAQRQTPHHRVWDRASSSRSNF